MDSDKNWHSLGFVDSFERDSLTPSVAGKVPILIVNGRSRRLVIPPSCPHMSNALADGVFDGHVLTCTKHLWQWSIDDGGKAIGAAEAPLLCYETEEREGQLYCRIADELKYEHQEEDDDY